MIALPLAQVNDRRHQRVENNQRFHRQPMRGRPRTTIGPSFRPRQSGSPTNAALADVYEAPGAFLDEQQGQPPPEQRMEPVRDDQETQVVTE